MQLLTYLTRIPILTVNGLLYLTYAFLGHLWLWVIAGAGLLILGVFDAATVRVIGASPSRIGGRPAPPAASGWGVRAFTLVALALACTAGIVYAEPIPFLLAGCWAASALALWLLPAEREPLLWRIKGTLLGYALALLGFKLLLSQMQGAAPEDWAAIVGSVGDAREALARTRDVFVSIGMLAVWYLLPLAHLSYLIQRLLINPVSLFHARKNTEDIVAALRRRN